MNLMLRYATLGLLAVSLSGCTLFQKKPATPPAEPAVESGPLGPTLGGANLGAEINAGALKVCSDADRNALFARLGDADAQALLNTRVFYFDTDKHDLKPDAAAALSAHARLLSIQPQARLFLAGHTDERGTQDYNLALGERRASTVARFLTTAGAKSEQLTSVSYGKERPAADGSGEPVWAQNRRVEIDYTVCR